MKFNHFIKVKLILFTHPQWHLAFGYHINIVLNYILSQIELKAKGYGIKNSIPNLMNQPNCTLDATTTLEYISQGRVFLLLMSKQNLKPSSSNTLRIVKNKLEMRKLWPPKVKGVKNSKKTNHWTLQRPVLKHPKVLFMLFCCY